MIPENRRQEAARAKIRQGDEGRGRLQQQIIVLAVGLSALLALLLV